MLHWFGVSMSGPDAEGRYLKRQVWGIIPAKRRQMPPVLVRISGMSPQCLKSQHCTQVATNGAGRDQMMKRGKRAITEVLLNRMDTIYDRKK